MNQNPNVADQQIADLLDRLTQDRMQGMCWQAVVYGRLPHEPPHDDNANLIGLWASLSVLVDNYAWSVCTGKDGDGRPVAMDMQQAAALHTYTMQIHQRLQAIATQNHSESDISAAQDTVKGWDYERCEDYVTTYGLAEGLDPDGDRRRELRQADRLDLLGLAIGQPETEGYLAQPPPAPPSQLVHWWASYHVITERYDQTICSGRNERGEAVPITAWERTKVTIFANKVSARLRLLAERAGHNYDAIEDARQEVIKWRPGQCAEYTAHYGLAEELEPVDEQDAKNMVVPAAYRNHGRRRGSRFPR